MKCPKDNKEKSDDECLGCKEYSALFSICNFKNINYKYK